ncbi:hypothetical protein AB1Y20_008673 [Prymnesium parvum]|uniref:Apple domain-containing protein n=1 Tax=Prymnesium parvum TaxID=97485 RepID=A0AB34ISC9_PRYPA
MACHAILSLLALLSLLSLLPLAAGSDAPPAHAVPDYRLKWLGPGREVSVSGDWDSWSRPGVQMRRDEGGVLAADIFLPEECPRVNLVMSGVCCYHYKFLVSFAGGYSRWLHDPKQPMDKDPDGWVNNFMCKYARTHDGQLQKSEGPPRALAAPQGKLSAGEPHAAADAAAAPTAAPGCLLLPATSFNGSTLHATSTRLMQGCCDACRRRAGCAAFNWRPEPLPRNCVMLGQDYGVARGTALSSAGTVSLNPVPLYGSVSPPVQSRPRKASATTLQAAHESGGARHKKRKWAHRKKKGQQAAEGA